MPLICRPSCEYEGWEIWGLEGVALDGGVLLRFFPDEIMVCGLLTCMVVEFDPSEEGLHMRVTMQHGMITRLEEVTATPAGEVLQAILEQLPTYPWEGKIRGCPITGI